MKKLNLEDILANTSDLTKEKKIWYVAIIWRPNAWKSTFINTLIWEKISITTNVPQTTRRKVLAIFNDLDSQIIFFDTPWIHKSEKKFNEKINDVAINSLNDSDLILYFIDSSRPWWVEENFIQEIIKKTTKTVIRVYTKLDLESKIDLPEGDNIERISSVSREGFERLLNNIKSQLKKWPILFPENIYTKQDVFFRISEIIREKTFLNTKEELPHSVYVWVEDVNDQEKILKIVAYIFTETDSQKYIVIWKAWSLIEKIWKESRLELEKIFGKKVFLALRVKVKKNWRKDDRLVEKILN